MARAYTAVYGVGVAIVPPRALETSGALRELGWRLVVAEDVSAIWRHACELDDPVIVTDRELSGFPRKCHILLEGESGRRSSPFAVMSSHGGHVSTPYKHFLEVL